MNILKGFSISIWCLIVISCEPHIPDEGSTPPPPSQGLFIEQFNPPTTYKVKDNRLFTINIQPVLNEETGIFRMWFDIEYNFNVVGRSNYVYFDETNPGLKTLEWGGGDDFGFGTWNDGYCTIIAHLERYDNFPDPNATYTDQTYRTGSNEIHIYKFLDSDIANSRYIEFDQQNNQYVYQHFWDQSLREAYNPTLVRFTVTFDQNNLNDELIEHTNDEMKAYISDPTHKQNESYYYLCGIQGFQDVNGNELPGILGSTPPNPSVPSERGSLIAYQLPRNTIQLPYSTAATTYNFWEKVFTKAVVHELAHQIGLGDDAHTNHSSGNIFCVMYANLYVGGRSTYENPHFCMQHINEILNSNP